MSQENVDVVRGMLEAFNRGDSDAVVAVFAEDCELHEPPEMPDSPTLGFRGYDGIREWMEKLRGVGNVRFELGRCMATGDVIVSEWTGSGRGESSGVPLEWSTFTVVHIGKGKIAKAQAFLSMAEALEAAGLSE